MPLPVPEYIEITNRVGIVWLQWKGLTGQRNGKLKMGREDGNA